MNPLNTQKLTSVFILESCRSVMTETAAFTPWVRRELATMHLTDIRECFGSEISELIRAIRAGRIVKKVKKGVTA